MKCVKYINICFKMKDKVDFNVFWNLQPIWTCFAKFIRKIEQQFLLLLFTNVFLLPSWIFFKKNDFLSNRQSFLCRFLGISLTCFLQVSMLREKWKQNTFLSKQKPYHRTISHRSRSLRLVQERFLLFHSNCK